MYVKIAIGGLNQSEMRRAVEGAGCSGVEVFPMSDIEAGRKIKAGEIDYYFGACSSGGGAAIAILIGSLGYGKCCTVAMAGGKKADTEKIRQYIAEGKVAFGMNVEAIGQMAPLLVRMLTEK